MSEMSALAYLLKALITSLTNSLKSPCFLKGLIKPIEERLRRNQFRQPTPAFSQLPIIQRPRRPSSIQRDAVSTSLRELQTAVADMPLGMTF
jgi:hypothetical protein